MKAKSLLTSSRRTISCRSIQVPARWTSYLLTSSSSISSSSSVQYPYVSLNLSNLTTTTTTTVITRHNAPLLVNRHNQQRSLSTSQSLSKGLQPDTSDPVPPDNSDPSSDNAPASLTDSEYHEIADQYLNTLVQVAEQKMEEKPDDKFEVEYAAGVLTLTTPTGTYVINKQPPNHQVWLSSPISGPKRYDWVVEAGGQHVKEGTELELGDDGQSGGGKWVYLRDGSTMTELLKKELEIDVAPSTESDVTLGREGPGGSG